MVIVNVLATVGIPIDVTCAPDRLADQDRDPLNLDDRFLGIK